MGSLVTYRGAELGFDTDVTDFMANVSPCHSHICKVEGRGRQVGSDEGRAFRKLAVKW